MILRFLRKHINNHPKISVFLAGIFCATSHAPLFFMPGLIGLSVLIYLIYNASSYREAILRNCSFGYGYFGGGLYWIAIGITVYIEDFWWLIPVSVLGIPLVFCIFTSFVAALAWRFRNNRYYLLIYTVSWIFIEWLTSWIFTGFPWMLLGYSVAFSDIMSQIAYLCGVIGISFVLLNLFGSFYYIWGYSSAISKYDIYYVISILVLVFGFGIYRLNNPTEFSDIKLRIVQPSIPQTAKWDVDLFWNNLEAHKNFSSINTYVKPDIILWSEAAVTTKIQFPVIRKYLNEIAKKTGAILMTGALSEVGDKIYTSVNAIDPNGRMLFEYHKRHLVPFGEYVPLREFFPIKKLTDGFEDYSVGEGDKIFTIKARKKELKIRPLICYESVFASEIDSGGADLLINFTNNAWYGDSPGPYQHFYIGKFRAIENGIPMIIVANNGVSGVIDSFGRIISKTKINDVVTLDSLAPIKLVKEYHKKAFLNYYIIIFVLILALKLYYFK